LGLSIHRYLGTLEHTAHIQTFSPFEVQNGPVSAGFDHELRGWGWTAGLSSRINERLTLGASYEGAFTVKGALTSLDTTVGTWFPYDQSAVLMPVGGSDVEIKYPGTLHAGVAFRPRNLLTTVFSADVVRRFWTDVADESYRTSAFMPQTPIRNTWDVRVGLEHVFYNQVAARFGFRYLENYADKESDRSIFSGGVGYGVAGYTFDVTLQYHRQTSRQGYIFDRNLSYTIPGTTSGSAVAPPGLSKVEDGAVALLVGVSRSF
jgi:long-subunit fatty acid transport protein